MEQRLYYVYLVTNVTNNVIYTGMTNNLRRRIWEHRNHVTKGFTRRYNVEKLVYYEVFPYVKEAIDREKQIKAGSRRKKVELIERRNKNWQDLYPGI